MRIVSPLRYPGGKSRALNMIMPLIPEFDLYIEPFLGGGSVFLGVKSRDGRNENSKSYWINDIYKDLYNFWTVLSENPNELENILLNWRRSYTNGKMLQQYLRMNYHKLNKIERSGAYLVVNRTSFSGIEGGFSALSYEQNFNEDIIKRLKDVSVLLKGAKITNLDYEDVIKGIIKNKEVKELKNTSIYLFLDPPYFNAAFLYGKSGNIHRYFDHYRFARIVKDLDENTDAKFMITYDDSPVLRGLYNWEGIKIIPMSFTYTSRGPKVGNEIMILNYEVDENLIKKISSGNIGVLNKGNKKQSTINKQINLKVDNGTQKTIEEAWG